MFHQTLTLHHFVMKEKYSDQIEITTVRHGMSPGIARGLLALQRQMGELFIILFLVGIHTCSAK